jgi:hypothetical protein
MSCQRNRRKIAIAVGVHVASSEELELIAEKQQLDVPTGVAQRPLQRYRLEVAQ